MKLRTYEVQVLYRHKEMKDHNTFINKNITLVFYYSKGLKLGASVCERETETKDSGTDWLRTAILIFF